MKRHTSRACGAWRTPSSRPQVPVFSVPPSVGWGWQGHPPKVCQEKKHNFTYESAAQEALARDTSQEQSSLQRQAPAAPAWLLPPARGTGPWCCQDPTNRLQFLDSIRMSLPQTDPGAAGAASRVRQLFLAPESHLIQHPANAPGRAVEDGQSAWAPAAQLHGVPGSWLHPRPTWAVAAIWGKESSFFLSVSCVALAFE